MTYARKRGNYKDPEKATEEVQKGNLSIRGAAAKYGIPRSTIHDHASLKVKEVSRPGPKPVLTKEEEEELVQWIVKMSEIGYDQCQQQVCAMVKRLLDQNGRQNPFLNYLRYPGKIDGTVS